MSRKLYFQVDMLNIGHLVTLRMLLLKGSFLKTILFLFIGDTTRTIGMCTAVDNQALKV